MHSLAKRFSFRRQSAGNVTSFFLDGKGEQKKYQGFRKTEGGELVAESLLWDNETLAATNKTTINTISTDNGDDNPLKLSRRCSFPEEIGMRSLTKRFSFRKESTGNQTVEQKNYPGI
eukprot:13136221-Ditylum_brightwellii.AAC.1